MALIAILVAAIAGYAIGSARYMTLAGPWMAASGVRLGDDGRPANSKDPVPYITAFVMAVLVAGMMRHVFVMSGIETVAAGLLTGLGLGLFGAAPWIVSDVMYSDRPKTVAPIDGSYAAGGLP